MSPLKPDPNVKVAIAADREPPRVRLHFGAEISWLSMPPATARSLAHAMLKAADKAEGK